MSALMIAAFLRASTSSAGARSSPRTLAPRRHAVIATTPVPQATSSTDCPARTSAKSTSAEAASVVYAASGENRAHDSRCTALNCANGSAVIARPLALRRGRLFSKKRAIRKRRLARRGRGARAAGGNYCCGDCSSDGGVLGLAGPVEVESFAGGEFVVVVDVVDSVVELAGPVGAGVVLCAAGAGACSTTRSGARCFCQSMKPSTARITKITTMATMPVLPVFSRSSTVSAISFSKTGETDHSRVNVATPVEKSEFLVICSVAAVGLVLGVLLGRARTGALDGLGGLGLRIVRSDARRAAAAAVLLDAMVLEAPPVRARGAHGD